MNKIRHASLFSGIGGPEIAAAMLGWENVFHCEINDFGRRILEYWFPKSTSYEDIKTTNFKQWRGKVDVLTGGFPCQPFSYAGQRRGADDDRYLWPQMLRAIEECRPAWVVGENVAGITTMVEQGTVSPMECQGSLFDEGDGVQRYRQEQSYTIERVCRDLESLGYAVQPIVIPACAVGAPHRRDRVFIIANSKVGGDGRVSREDAGTSGAERLQERDEIRESHLADKVRPEMSTLSQDTDSLGLQGRVGQLGHSELHGNIRTTSEDGKTQRTPSDTFGRGEGTPREGGSLEGDGSDLNAEPSQWREPSEWSSRFYELLRYAFDTSDTGFQKERPEQQAAGTPGTISSIVSKRPSSDTDGQRSSRCGYEGQSRHQEGISSWSDSGYVRKGTFSEIERLGRWSDFPTVSPIYRGNDGLPFNVDDLTIPFSKWRTESLKAYGNAIVPQVMYEIFKAIETIERNR